MSHTFGWVDKECASVSRCENAYLDTAFLVDIYDYSECPKCHREFKLHQVNELVEKKFKQEDLPL